MMLMIAKCWLNQVRRDGYPVVDDLRNLWISMTLSTTILKCPMWVSRVSAGLMTVLSLLKFISIWLSIVFARARAYCWSWVHPASLSPHGVGACVRAVAGGGGGFSVNWVGSSVRRSSAVSSLVVVSLAGESLSWIVPMDFILDCFGNLWRDGVCDGVGVEVLY